MDSVAYFAWRLEQGERREKAKQNYDNTLKISNAPKIDLQPDMYFKLPRVKRLAYREIIKNRKLTEF